MLPKRPVKVSCNLCCSAVPILRLEKQFEQQTALRTDLDDVTTCTLNSKCINRITHKPWPDPLEGMELGDNARHHHLTSTFWGSVRWASWRLGTLMMSTAAEQRNR